MVSVLSEESDCDPKKRVACPRDKGLVCGDPLLISMPSGEAR